MRQRDVVGIVTRYGYLICSPCAKRYGYTVGSSSPVYRDAAPHNAESCDECHRPVSEAR